MVRGWTLILRNVPVGSSGLAVRRCSHTKLDFGALKSEFEAKINARARYSQTSSCPGGFLGQNSQFHSGIGRV